MLCITLLMQKILLTTICNIAYENILLLYYIPYYRYHCSSHCQDTKIVKELLMKVGKV